MAIRSGELSPTEHVGDVLDRLAADPYNLVVTLDAERALAQAAALTEELAQGRWRGPWSWPSCTPRSSHTARPATLRRRAPPTIRTTRLGSPAGRPRDRPAR